MIPGTSKTEDVSAALFQMPTKTKKLNTRN